MHSSFLFPEEAYDEEGKGQKHAQTRKVSGNAFDAVFHEDRVGEDGEDEENDREFTHFVLGQTVL